MGKFVKGIKGLLWLYFVLYFNIVFGMVIDYMYGVFFGVQKMMLELWFGVKYKGKDFNINNCVCEVDNRFQSIRLIFDVIRFFRLIEKDLKYWKVLEFRFFLLYFGGLVLYGILDKDRFFYYFLLVDLMYIFLKCGFIDKDLDKVESFLIRFCSCFENLYERCFLRFNVY